jgi:hypothetical protein
MSIRNKLKKINPSNFLRTRKGLNIYFSIVLILIAVASFGLGRLSKIEENKVPIELEASAVLTEGELVGSKNGSVYHLPWCSGAQRIKEENKVWFNSKEEAEKAGYRAATNCKGI